MSNQPPLNPDALAQLIMWKDFPFGGKGAHVQLDANAAHAVIKLLKPHLAVAQPVVSSVEELNKLPVGSVLLDGTFGKWVFEKVDDSTYQTTGVMQDMTAEEISLPARVVYTPEVKP